MLMNDISFRENQSVLFFFYKIRFFMKRSWINFLNLSFSLERGIVVQRVEKSNVLMLLQEEMDLDCMHS